MTARSRLASLAIGLGLLVVLLAAWKAYVEWFDVSRFVLPPPESVGRATIGLMGESNTWTNAWVTLREIVGGFALATVSGVIVGVLIGEVPVVERALNPYLVAVQVVPKVAVIPLLLLWLGFGTSAKVIVAAVFAFFPVLAGTRAGIRSVDPRHRDLAATMQTRRRQRLLMIDLPSALPSILTGMEVGIVLATVGAVVAEYLAGSEGLGWLAVVNLNQLQVDALFGVIVILSAMGFLVYGAVAALRRRLVPWHPSAIERPPGL